MPRCTICAHPRHRQITEALARLGTRATARQFRVSRPALDRHKRHAFAEKDPNTPPRATLPSKVCGGLSPRQARFVEGVVAGQSFADAARNAGYAEATAKVPMHIISTPAVRAAFAELLPQPDEIAERIREGLGATRTELVKHEGKITAREELVDFSERRKYSELAARLRGLMPESKPAGPNVAVQVNIGSQARPQSQEELERAIAVEIHKLTDGFNQSTIARLKRVAEETLAHLATGEPCLAEA